MARSESIEELLLTEMSRRNTTMVADIVIQKPELFDELVRIYLRNEEPVSRYAAWVADTVSEQRPEFLSGYTGEIITMLPQFMHDGLKRHSLRMLVRSSLPSDQLGPLMNLCFDWLLSANEAVAAKVYCMDILYRISEIEPAMKKELADSIEWRINEEKPGFKSHGKKILDKLYKEIESTSV